MLTKNSPEEGMEKTTPVSTVLKLSPLGLDAENCMSQGTLVTKTKKKRKRGRDSNDKSGPGLREISMKVLEKVQSKGRTTYNEVADELVAEYGDSANAPVTDDHQEESADPKSNNIHRRIYDALNVLVAMDIITKDRKEVQWKGLATCSDVEGLKRERMQLQNLVEKKAAYLQELEEQLAGYENLARRNKELYSNGVVPSGGVALPFILVKTTPSAVVEVEISDDMKLVHFDFDSTPFELYDEKYVLKEMQLCERTQPNGECNPPVNADEDITNMPVTDHPQVSQGPTTESSQTQLPQLTPPTDTHESQISPHNQANAMPR